MGTTAGRRPGCATCRLSTTLKAEIARRARAGESFRSLAELVTNNGHAIGRDGVAAHLRGCVGLDEPGEAETPDVTSVLVARTVADHLRVIPRVAEEIAQALAGYGLTTEAAVMQSHLPDSLRAAIEATSGTPAGELIVSRALALAVRRVLGVSHPEAARDIADDLRQQGCLELADAFLFLADRATAMSAVTATKNDGRGVEPAWQRVPASRPSQAEESS